MINDMDNGRLAAWALAAWESKICGLGADANTYWGKVDELHRSTIEHVKKGTGGKANSGLLGGLTGTLLEPLTFTKPATVSPFGPMKVADEATVPHDLGLEVTKELSYEAGETVTLEAQESSAIETGLEITVGYGGATGGKFELKGSVKFTTTRGKTEAHSEDRVVTSKFTVGPFKVKKGRVYKIVIVQDYASASLPYEIRLRVTGDSVVDLKKKTYRMSAGESFERIGFLEAAYEESKSFSRDPSDPSAGLYATRGSMKVSNAFNSVLRCYDVTDELGGMLANAKEGGMIDRGAVAAGARVDLPYKER